MWRRRERVVIEKGTGRKPTDATTLEQAKWEIEKCVQRQMPDEFLS